MPRQLSLRLKADLHMLLLPMLPRRCALCDKNTITQLAELPSQQDEIKICVCCCRCCCRQEDLLFFPAPNSWREPKHAGFAENCYAQLGHRVQQYCRTSCTTWSAVRDQIKTTDTLDMT
eukprot:GHUV01050444.1.p2 GENE.GHUV01050444.1~~GHUV01050444.1.p2  ORF type:complete len:119 (-),score=22.14 GHUV01050444.1:129-485(-)